MNILHISNCFKPAWESGGVARYTYEITRELSSRGHDVTVFTTDGYIENIEQENPVDIDGINTYYFDNLFPKLYKKIKLSTPYDMPLLAREIMAKFDIVHIHEHRTPPGAVAAWIAKKHDIPYLIQPHGSLPQNTGNTLLKKTWDGLVGDRMLHHADGYIALHKYEKSQLKRQCGIRADEISIIKNGFRPIKTNTKYNVEDFELSVGLSTDKRTALYVGRLSKRKGVDKIIDVASNYTDVEFLIIGPDEGEKDRLISIVKKYSLDNVYILGFVPEKTKIDAYIYSDIFIIPTQRGEGLPTTVLEALYYRCPIVGTSAANIDFVESNGAGLITGISSSELIKGTGHILRKDLSKMGERGNSLIKKEFSWKSIGKNIESVYKNL